MDEFHQVLAALRQPEYVHVLLNPLPVYGVGCGVLALATGLIFKSRPAQLVALLLILLGTLSVWPVMEYGEVASNRVFDIVNKAGQQWLHAHEARAEKLAPVFYITAGLALAALLAAKFFPKIATALALITLGAGIISLTAGAYIGHAGGQVRHSEFRQGQPPSD